MGGKKFSFSRVDLRRSGPKIKVTIGHPRATLLAANQAHVELKKPFTVTALIDTGASRTVISPQLAATCGLRQTGEARISSAGHITQRPEFAGAVHFPDTDLNGFDPVSLIACPLPEQDVACLLGRDILERWNLMYDGRSGQIEIEE